MRRRHATHHARTTPHRFHRVSSDDLVMTVRVLHVFRVVDGGADLEWVAELPTEPHTNEWLECHPTNGHLYALAAPDRTACLQLGPNGTPLSIETFPVGGGGAHMDLSQDGRWAVLSSYQAGEVEVLPILADATFGRPVDSKVVANRLFQYLHRQIYIACLPASLPPTHPPLCMCGTCITRTRYNPALADRQDGPHPHQARLDPFGNRWCLVCDLGSDVVWVYGFNTATGHLSGASSSPRHLRLPQGSGPRHLDFHPSGKWVFISCELTGDIVVAEFDAEGTGALTSVQTICALPAGVKCSRAGSRGNADIHCSADGRFVFATTRTNHAIVTFAVDPTSGHLTLRSRCGSGGQTPRHFHLDGKYLRVVNQDGVDGSDGTTGCVVTFRIAEDGTLSKPRTLPVDGCPAMITPPYSLGPSQKM